MVLTPHPPHPRFLGSPESLKYLRERERMRENHSHKSEFSLRIDFKSTWIYLNSPCLLSGFITLGAHNTCTCKTKNGHQNDN